MRLCIEFPSLPWVPYLCHPLRWSQINFAKFCFDKSHCKCHSHLPSPFKGHLFVNFLRWNFENLLTGLFLTLFENDFALSQNRADNVVFQPCPPVLLLSSRKTPDQSTGRFKKNMAGGGGSTFSARIQNFHFGPFWTILDQFLWWMVWTALTLPGSGTSPALGATQGRPKFR